MEEWNSPVNGVLVSLADVRYGATHDVVRGGVDMVGMVGVHCVVQVRRMVETLQSGPVSHVGLVQPPRRAPVHVSWMDALVILPDQKEEEQHIINSSSTNRIHKQGHDKLNFQNRLALKMKLLNYQNVSCKH